MSIPVRTQIVQVMLPWFGQDDGELYYSSMSISQPGKVDRRKAYRRIRIWYKKSIGINVDNRTLYKIWKRRHTTFALDENMMKMLCHQLARTTYEETIEESDSCIQEETTGETRE